MEQEKKNRKTNLEEQSIMSVKGKFVNETPENLPNIFMAKRRS